MSSLVDQRPRLCPRKTNYDKDYVPTTHRENSPPIYHLDIKSNYENVAQTKYLKVTTPLTNISSNSIKIHSKQIIKE